MPTEQPPADSGLTEIERLTAILDSDNGEPKAPEPDQEAEQADEVVEEEAPAEDGTEEASEEESPTEEEPEEEAKEEDQATSIEIDGDPVTIDELKLGYLRQSDYTKKTQAVAEQRRTVEQQARQYESSLNALLTAAGADLSRFEGVNWEQVAVDNPDQYRQAKAIFEQTRQTYNFIKSQADDHIKRMQEQAQSSLRERAKESLGILKSTVPNWSNDLYYRIGEYAQKSLGVSADEFNNIADHRSIIAMYKAMQFDQAKKVSAEKKVKASPGKTLSGAKADAKKVSRTETYRKTRERLKKSGSMDDAVAALLNRT
jgi:hypothetical protein